ncbi:unnamed protein product [Phytophthora fragariaefolia]|uniref:Unnamed protein product n=1 Tax=Phytophthora fragariaefolia TaxID=1490495 RepID=A0A9W6XM77_9STRA|nr:unnamed protein product [Phytophthora fragariaefolia]
MGRYTTVQTFSDQDAQGAAVAYDAERAPAAANDAEKPKDADKVRINRVENVSGSSAGAGSGEFHTEMERVAAMEQRYKANKAQQEFEAKRKRNAEEFDAKMQKRADKRRRRKERVKAKALDAAREEEEQKEGEKTSADKEQVPDTPGGVPEIPNDGSFLEKMLALQKQKDSGVKET